MARAAAAAENPGAVLNSPHAHCKNIREQMQTTTALLAQEYTGADADHPRTPRRRNTGACSDHRPALRSFPSGHTAAARAIACGLSLLTVRCEPPSALHTEAQCRVVLHPQDRSGSVERSIRRQKAERTRFPARQLNRVGRNRRMSHPAEWICSAHPLPRCSLAAADSIRLSPCPPKSVASNGQLRLRASSHAVSENTTSCPDDSYTNRQSLFPNESDSPTLPATIVRTRTDAVITAHRRLRFFLTSCSTFSLPPGGKALGPLPFVALSKRPKSVPIGGRQRRSPVFRPAQRFHTVASGVPESGRCSRSSDWRIAAPSSCSSASSLPVCAAKTASPLRALQQTANFLH